MTNLTMTPNDMAAIYARAFPDSRAWDAHEITAMITAPGGFACTAPHGFAIGRVIVDEAELITIAVDPAHHRNGTGRALLQQYETTAQTQGASRTFLEVREDNLAAIALYMRAGWRQTARRKGYYRLRDGRAFDALILEKPLKNAIPDATAQKNMG